MDTLDLLNSTTQQHGTLQGVRVHQAASAQHAMRVTPGRSLKFQTLSTASTECVRLLYHRTPIHREFGVVHLLVGLLRLPRGKAMFISDTCTPPSHTKHLSNARCPQLQQNWPAMVGARHDADVLPGQGVLGRSFPTFKVQIIVGEKHKSWIPGKA